MALCKFRHLKLDIDILKGVTAGSLDILKSVTAGSFKLGQLTIEVD